MTKFPWRSRPSMCHSKPTSADTSSSGPTVSTAMAYGGRSGGSDKANVAYVASGKKLAVRENIVSSGLADFVDLPYSDKSLKGGDIRDIALDPEEWRVGWVVDSKGQVFLFQNGDLPTALAPIVNNPQPAHEVVPRAGAD